MDSRRQDCRAVGSVGAAVQPLKLFTQPLGVLNGNWVVGFHQARQPATVSKVGAAVSLEGLGQSDGILAQRHGQHSHDAIRRQPTQVKNLILRVPCLGSILFAVVVAQRAVFQLMHRHSARVQRPQRIDGAGRAAADLGKRIAIGQRVSGKHLSKLKRSLPAVRLLIQQSVQRQIAGALFAALLQPAVNVQRNCRHVFCNQPHAGQHGTAFERRFRRDSHARRATAWRIVPAVRIVAAATQINDLERLFRRFGVRNHSVRMSHVCAGAGAVAVS